MINYQINEPGTLDYQEVFVFFKETEELMIPSLSTLVNLEEYSRKITSRAVIFTARDDEKIVGLSAIYFYKAPDFSYSTMMMVKREYQLQEMIGVELSKRVKDYIKRNDSAGLRFEIRKSNQPLVRYHLRRGARIVSESVYPGTDVVSLLMEISY
jgi:hypothetical protein